VLKTKTQTAAVNNANSLTITSPNTKIMFLKAYLVAYTGTDGPAATMTIQITEEGNLTPLWEDAILIGVTNENSGPFRAYFTFPGLGLPIKTGKNCTVAVSSGGAATGSELSLIYNI
jgi:hypothetical protein